MQDFWLMLLHDSTANFLVIACLDFPSHNREQKTPLEISRPV